ncbi:MAG: cation diffusion facilitator family transporter [Candidatus Omnitrophica bacterium]|nr:cation diffusion facilitator family transporter [Candidatus Omnitrophota bacterium]
MSMKQKYMLRAVKISLFGNIILFSIKALALLFVNSLAIIADLGISSVALAISVILYHSIKLADKPADFFHNYGYAKVEHVCEAMEGLVLIGIAFTLSSQAVLNIIHPRQIHMPWVGLISSSMNTTINFLGAFYILNMGKKTSSPAIHAEGIHYRLEGFISLAIAASFVISIVLRSKGLERIEAYVDPSATLLVSFMVLIPSFSLAKKAFFNLLDASIEEEGKIEVVKLLGQHSEKYCDFKDIKTRSAGRKKFVELKLIMPQDMAFKKGHEIVTILEKDIRKSIHDSEITIKMEPCGKDCYFVHSNKNCPYL